MADDVLLDEAATIERCVFRDREEHAGDAAGFALSFTRQDAAILNIQRACEAALDEFLDCSALLARDAASGSD